MLSFENDYSCAATPEIIARLAETAPNQYPGYGTDDVCESAKAKIREACACPDAEIFFLVGGTQTNQVVIDAITPPYAGVVAATTGHVNVHEAGAIEFTGHKVLTLPHHDGKIDADELGEYCATFYADGNYTHMVFPGCVYISQATEYGTLYTLAELEAIRKVCTKYDMPLFIDGARLGYALTATGNDVTIEDIARLADVFYIGGTKVGAMFGEAVVFTHGNMPKHFVTIVKQHGALLAKGWLLGLQFDTLFTDGLYLRIARHANDAADRIRKVLVERGYTLTFDAPTNQIFVTLDNATSERLQRDVTSRLHGKGGRHAHRDAHLHQLGHDRRAGGRAGRTAVKDSPQNKESREIAPGFSLMYNDCIAIAAGAIQQRLSAIASRSIATNLRTDDSTE